MKCVTFVSDTFTRYGSNTTNVWQEILTPMTLAFCDEGLCTKNYENMSIFVKVTAKKNQWHLFYVDTVYSVRYIKKTKTIAVDLTVLNNVQSH